jgi:glycine cleavage system aminomethyltransferase T
MSTMLDFLSPGLADRTAVARSPLDRAQRNAGALFSERDGWLVAATIPGEDEHLASCGVADLSHLAKLEVRPSPDELELEGVVRYRVSPRRTLLLGLPGGVRPLWGQTPDAGGETPDALAGRLVVDVTAQYAIVALAGPQAQTVLSRLTHLHHFPSGGEVAHVTAHVLERRGGYWILVSQELGHYLWEVAVDRCQPLGGGPVGVDAYEKAVAA